MRDVAR
ncbi:hypothetical protein Ga0076813_14131, partial [endosymbiont of Ridgeia piscesae]